MLTLAGSCRNERKKIAWENEVWRKLENGKGKRRREKSERECKLLNSLLMLLLLLHFYLPRLFMSKILILLIFLSYKVNRQTS